MPYITAQGFRSGLRAGIDVAAQRERKRRNQVEEQRYAEALQKAKEEEAADLKAQLFRLDEIKDEEMRRKTRQGLLEALGAGGLMGVLTHGPQALQPVAQTAQRFEGAKRIAERLSPQHRARFLEEEVARQKTMARERAGQQVAKGIQERMAMGAYNFEGENEPSPEIQQRLQTLMEALDGGADPVKVMDLDSQILGAVQKDNERRMQRKAGLTIVDSALNEAVQANDTEQARKLIGVKALYMSGALDEQDLMDHTFAAQTGRLTDRHAVKLRMEIQQQAYELWKKANTKDLEAPDRLPDDQELAPYIAFVTGQRQQMGEPVPDGMGAPQGPLAGQQWSMGQNIAPSRGMGTIPPMDPERLAKAQTPEGQAEIVAKGKQQAEELKAAKKKMPVSEKAARTPRKKAERGPAWTRKEKPTPWEGLGKRRRNDAVRRLADAVKRGASPEEFDRIVNELGVSGEDIPPDVLKEIRKKAGKAG